MCSGCWRFTKRAASRPEALGCRGHGKEKLIRGVERAQKERIRRDLAGTTQAGACEALSCEVCSGEGYEETDCIMEREIVELLQPGFNGWAGEGCGVAYVSWNTVGTNEASDATRTRQQRHDLECTPGAFEAEGREFESLRARHFSALHGSHFLANPRLPTALGFR
jgi:hypothetical protein